MPDDGGETNANRSGILKMEGQLLEDFSHGCRFGGLGSGQTMTRGNQFAGLNIHQGTLDA